MEITAEQVNDKYTHMEGLLQNFKDENEALLCGLCVVVNNPEDLDEMCLNNRPENIEETREEYIKGFNEYVAKMEADDL